MIGQDRSRCDESLDIISSLLLCVGSTPFRILVHKVVSDRLGRKRLTVIDHTVKTQYIIWLLRAWHLNNRLDFVWIRLNALSCQEMPMERNLFTLVLLLLTVNFYSLLLTLLYEILQVSIVVSITPAMDEYVISNASHIWQPL